MYTSIIIVGTGKIACSCLDYVMSRTLKENILVYEYCPSSLSTLGKKAEQHIVDYAAFDVKSELTEQLLTIEEMTLIVSANNTYLFPECICSRGNFTIINYHSALLPKYAGMNAITWTIYSGEKTGGITWHLVDEQIDHGDILIQKTCDIGEDMTAIQLNRIYDQLAFEAFKEIFPALLSNTYCSVKQTDVNQRKYRKAEIPSNGHLDLTRGTKFLYRLLRSLDYGLIQLFPMPVVQYGQQIFCVKRYQFSASVYETKEISLEGEQLTIKDENGLLNLWLKQE